MTSERAAARPSQPGIAAPPPDAAAPPPDAAAPPPASAGALRTAPDGSLPRGSRARVTAEVWIVLGLSLGQSGVYSVISLVAKLTQGPLSKQTATLNPSQSAREYLDLTYQVADVVFTLVPVALVLWLLAGDESSRRVTRRLGLDRTRPLADLGAGVLLAAVIGIPGIGLYLVGHALGITATVVPEALNQYWWTLPVLVLQALKNAVLEEVVVVGYLVTRLRQLGVGGWAATVISAVLRGSYHLYQGFGPFVGNVFMGLVFAEWFRRRGRVLPLIVAHTVLDTASFVGYDLLKPVLHLP